jgi:acetyl-CoA carboxylase biotin carboxyl carrier protein
MKINEIQDLIKFVAKSGVSEVELETKEIKIIIKTPAAGKIKDNTTQQNFATPVFNQQPQQPTIQQAATIENLIPIAPPVASTSNESKYITIKSPMIGTFYRSAGPDKPAFINVGDEVIPGKTVCIIEAMKLFNEIESDLKGKIVKVLANDASPVEYDQPLFLIDPTA